MRRSRPGLTGPRGRRCRCHGGIPGRTARRRRQRNCGATTCRRPCSAAGWNRRPTPSRCPGFLGCIRMYPWARKVPRRPRPSPPPPAAPGAGRAAAGCGSGYRGIGRRAGCPDDARPTGPGPGGGPDQTPGPGRSAGARGTGCRAAGRGIGCRAGCPDHAGPAGRGAGGRPGGGADRGGPPARTAARGFRQRPPLRRRPRSPRPGTQGRPTWAGRAPVATRRPAPRYRPAPPYRRPRRPHGRPRSHGGPGGAGASSACFSPWWP